MFAQTTPKHKQQTVFVMVGCPAEGNAHEFTPQSGRIHSQRRLPSTMGTVASGQTKISPVSLPPPTLPSIPSAFILSPCCHPFGASLEIAYQCFLVVNSKVKLSSTCLRVGCTCTPPKKSELHLHLHRCAGRCFSRSPAEAENHHISPVG